MAWAWLAVLAAGVWSLINIADKYILTKWIKQPLVTVVVLGVVGFLTAVAIYLVKGFSPLPALYILLSLFAGFIYIAGNYFYFRAAQKEEISKVVPLMYMDPLFTALIAALFLHEILTPIKYAAIVMMVIGAVLVSTSKFKLSFSRALFFAVLSALSFALSSAISKAALGHADFWTVFAYVKLGTFISLIFIFPLCYNAFRQTIAEIKGKIIFVGLNECANVLASLFFIISISKGFVTLATALTTIQPFFVLIFATVASVFFPGIIKEEIGKGTIAIKVFAISLMVAGTVLIT